MTANYAHPAEIVILGIGTYLGPLFLIRHIMVVWLFTTFRIFQAVERHSGYDVSFLPTSLIPIWAGPVHHDFHHEKFDYNYASFFTIWDWVLGTDVQFRQEQHIKYTTRKNSWSDIIYKLGLASYKKDSNDNKAKIKN
ncbi:hypothetical protein THRCLA_01491 [Thraustotheca clavata]|uniref:Fatty acid hydroxylase domain-containing protein n=1 Tax=Thraustotheca clavata TaxID=74557 RepID=A0A1W0A8X9_9STRA|nr:hypothetical protein THRCLA_01491 [Thraustotheca clavata]